MAEADRPIQAERAVPVTDIRLDAAAPDRRWRNRALMFCVPAALAAAGAWFWATGGGSVATDNAYVKQDIVSVSSDVSGRIVSVGVHENQVVKAGDLLFRIDPDPYKVALAQADAAMASAQVRVMQLRADYAATDADIDSAHSDLDFARSEFDRQRTLMQQGFTTKARLQQAQNALDVATAALRNKQNDAGKAKVALATGAQVPGVNPAIATAQAQRAEAMLNLRRTEVRAPFSGRVSQTGRLQVGQMMVTGLPALSIVADDRSWIEANFKESQLDRMRPGQPARITIDAYPGVVLRGHVDSIGSGTGSEFSVLPAQNANGNWVKVTQRIPVRIALDDRTAHPLIAGMSADVRVDVRPETH